MNTTTLFHRDDRFTGDLWNTNQATIETAVRAILEERGLTVLRVSGRSSGLYVGAFVLYPNKTSTRLVQVNAAEVRTFVWSNS